MIQNHSLNNNLILIVGRNITPSFCITLLNIGSNSIIQFYDYYFFDNILNISQIVNNNKFNGIRY